MLTKYLQNWKYWKEETIRTTSRKYEYNINIYVREIVRKGVDWIDLDQDSKRW